MSFRFVHAADIHLDSPLRSLALRDPALGELVGNATRQAFAGIVALCLEERVDALLIAGDLYDGDQTSMKTALFLARQLHRLHEAGVATFVVRGNHDALSRITRELVLPDSVNVFGGRAEALDVAQGRDAVPVVVHGLSFAQPHAPESLLGRYKPPVAGAVNIGLMHTSLDGAPGHDRYAPCAASDLLASGFDYWALGHIHKRSVIAGRSTIVMPGMPQGRDINEAGPKSVSLVTIGDDRTVHVEARETAIAQFERVAVDLAGIDDWRDMVAAIGAALAERRAIVVAEHLIARLTLTGATSLAWRIRGDFDLVRAEVTSRAEELRNCWIEGVDPGISVPAAPISADAGSAASAIAELHHLIASDILPAEAYHAALADLADELRGQLPSECRHLLAGDEAESRLRMVAYAREGAEDVIARLQAGPGNGDR